MTELSTTNELIHDVLVRGGEATDTTTDTDFESYSSVITWINRAYRFICNARTDWTWLRKNPPGTLLLQPKITTGTVTVTNNSTTITFTSGPAATVAGWYFRPANSKDTYRIATHSAASTSATLDTAYTDDTASGASYTLFKLDYTLASDVVRVIDPFTMTQSGSDNRYWGELRRLSPSDMARNYPINFLQSGIPEYYSFVGETIIHLNTYPTELTRCEYAYHYRPDDLTAGSTPVLPVERRVLLADFALAMLLDMKSDDRADKWMQLADINMKNFIMEYEYRLQRQAPSLLRVFPRNYGSTSDGIVRSTSGLRFHV